VPGGYGSHLELLELALQLKRMFTKSPHSSLVPHFLEGEVGVTGLLSSQERLKDKGIKATALRLGSLPLGKAHHIPGWVGESSGESHLASPTSCPPHPLPTVAVPPSPHRERSLCAPYAEGPKAIDTGEKLGGQDSSGEKAAAGVILRGG